METAKIRDGAYGNFVTGMGRRDTDKTENTFVNPYAGTDIVELARIKVQDGIAARIVECVPETRRAFRGPTARWRIPASHGRRLDCLGIRKRVRH